jgi:hypothetical protein
MNAPLAYCDCERLRLENIDGRREGTASMLAAALESTVKTPSELVRPLPRRRPWPSRYPALVDCITGGRSNDRWDCCAVGGVCE